MLLSIGMIMKNEEKHLRDCLTGLKPILEQVHSELIIYDTGSTDASVEIAKEFTKKVFHCEWRGDFAWARNHTLDKALGKWYMFIDADEVFRDTTDLINFFNSGEYKKYGSATINMNNLNNKNTKNLFHAMRVFKKYKNIQFLGKIHEYIPAPMPTRNLNSLLDHYGYLYETKEARKIKHERNIAPLLEQYEEEPDNPRHVSHLINEYSGEENKDERIKYIHVGLDLLKDNYKEYYFHAFHFNNISHYHDLSLWEEALEAVDRYLSITKMLSKVAVPIRAMQSQALRNLKRYKDAAEAGIAALEMYDKDELGQLDNKVSTVLILPIPFSNRDSAIDNIVFNYMLDDDFDSALEWDKKYTKSKKDTLFMQYAAEALKTKQYANLAKLFDYAYTHYGEGTPEYDNIIATIENSLTTHKVKEIVAEAICKHPGESDYIRYMRLRKDRNAEDLRYFLELDRPLPQHFADVLVIAMEEKQDFSAFLDKLDIEDTPRLLSHLLRSNPNIDNTVANLLAEGLPAHASLKCLRVFNTITLIIFSRIAHNAKAVDEGKNEFVLSFFERRVRLHHAYLAQIYRPEIYNDQQIETLPEQDRFVYFAGCAFECRDKGDTAAFARYLRMALRANRGIKDIVQLLGEQLKEQEAAPPPPSPQDELAAETAKLKAIINTMIAIGNFGQAGQILETYAQINPTDPDIERIKEKLDGASIK
ncbi:MAG: glycosyltransferase [Defluviitaleaceae bacterium]|nr:glycosyltransferase [Defluviitaleaceae bacterium]MCL2239562.1 glycosyltransferase [Defluviitaleaceae bacterium]